MAGSGSSQESKLPSPLGHHVGRGLREASLFLLLAVAIYMVVALVTYHPNDPGWSFSGSGGPVDNAGGVVGAWLADLFLYLFGYLAFLFPVMIAFSGWLAWRWQRRDGAFHWGVFGLRFVGFVFTLASGAGLATLHVEAVPQTVPLHSGGILGDVIGTALEPAFSFLGATLLLLAVFLASVTLFTGLSWLSLMDLIGQLCLAAGRAAGRAVTWVRDGWAGRRARKARRAVVTREKEKNRTRKTPQIEPSKPAPKPGKKADREKQMPLFHAEPTGDGLPPVSLLDQPPEHKGGYSKESLEAMSRQLEKKLADFGVEVEVVAVHPGPVITRFEAQPAAGVKVSQISNLAKDLARALSVVSVRVVEVIPGKSVVGLEIPNEHRQVIAFSEIVRAEVWEKAQSPLSMALGKDIGGEPVVVDLGKMPHLLVAGTTGSGKSVGVNGMILSLLYKNRPEDVRLIMVDPKMLELSIYDGIPHLLAPVVTDMKEAANALRWCVGEMERRYRLMAALGVRNITGYNRKVREAADNGEPLRDPLWKAPEEDPQAEAPELEPLPFIVVVVDEFADMMMMVGKKVEELIARLAQKARAAGLHLILATQRPSVDVITGLIKANIPTRMAFQVSSRVDSRTILDQMGAEALLGHGDMLYLASGSSMPTRVHGAFVSDNDVHRVVNHLRSLGEPEYVDGILEETSGTTPIPGVPGEDGGGDGEQDPLYDQAVQVVTETRRASISGVQRRLKIGYNRAARLVEEMENSGVVGPLQSNGAREVLAPPPPRD
ncbi:DNA translocase FtsK 4TM domain-containing protein [Aquisalimonas lutea]|uniref:DNA translocase FtsK n=1 Tax=Aquisalimonas lutea TaxID=1327750 RepID=UPI0025B502CE|nr:DNA translocase FtsK [Aquisalimonas lutea]MDN3518597.1 DNA translocase FtsK 4TM domain-containing protein [Aquisalimonas lutea]